MKHNSRAPGHADTVVAVDTDIPSLLLPIDGNIPLLLPSVSIAEIIHYNAPQPVLNAPDWLLGSITWRTLEVPLLSFERLNGQTLPQISPKCHVAVLNNTGISSTLPFIAIVIQNIPHLLRVSSADIREEENTPLPPMALLMVTVAGERALIPKTAALEQAYCDYLQG